MLTLLKIKNIALIDELSVEFGDGLNLLTGETGSGKSIIVDSLGALTGDRLSSDLIKQGEDSARIEGLFTVRPEKALAALLDDAGIDHDGELIIRRELSLAGKNRVFINNQLVTQGLLKQVGRHHVDIHGQGEQTSLYDAGTHISILDDFAGVQKETAMVAGAFADWSRINTELNDLQQDEAEKLRMIDILRFQVNEIALADLKENEDAELQQEKLRLSNVEKLSTLSDEIYGLLYEDESSTISTLERAARKVDELSDLEPELREYNDGLRSARAVIEDVALTARNLRAKLEFSPERLNEIETRLADIARLTRKYGGTLASVLEHLSSTRQRLDAIETAEFREEEMRKQLAAAAAAYTTAADKLTKARKAAASRFGKEVENELKLVALDKARFEARVETTGSFSANGSDNVEFFFSANPGEDLRPLAKVASGGEASRLMLILKTVSRAKEAGKTVVFDEIDVGIGGRVAEAVGRKLKAHSADTQVFCVTHQAQIASLADHHFVVEKESFARSTHVVVRELTDSERIDEIARMLAGEHISDAARDNAKAMLAAAN